MQTRIVKKPLPPITWFRAFDATARHLSFTLAAQELGFTQSAISQNVRALEDKLGTALFVRGHRTLSLTEAGRLLVPDVAAAMAQLEQATARFLPPSSGPKLTIATSVSIAQWIIAPRLSQFLEAQQGCALQIATTIWPDDFASTNADIEIRFGSRQVVGADAMLLQPSYLHAVAAPEIASRCDPKNMAAQRLIQPIGISTGWQNLAKRATQEHSLEAEILVDTHGLAVDMAVCGAGIALSHSQITRAPIADGRLVELPLPEVPADEGYYLARKTDKHSDIQDAFIDWITRP